MMNSVMVTLNLRFLWKILEENEYMNLECGRTVYAENINWGFIISI
jgi:hypothetical protein